MNIVAPLQHLNSSTRQPNQRRVLLSAIASSLLLSACSVVQTPDYRGQADEFASQQATQHESQWRSDEKLAEEDSEPSSLLDLIALPTAADSVAIALEANPGLLQTAAALKMSVANVTNASSDRYPNANLTVGGNKTENTPSSYNAELGVSWTVDIWGKISDGVDAAEAELIASQAGYQAARDLLASRVISLHLQLIQQQQLVSIKTAQLQILESNEAAIVERYKKGLSDLSGLDTARSNSESARATVVSHQENLNNLQRSLTLLLAGRHSEKAAEITTEKAAELTLEQTAATGSTTQAFPDVLVPVTQLPQQDLARRPDLQQAYANIAVAEANSRIAYKALLPSFSLQAALTDTGTNLSDALFNSTSWNLLGQLTAPLFQAGKLRSQAEVARLTAEQKYLAYQETLLTAVNEVENALGQEASLTQQQQHIRAALNNAQRSEILYQDKYRQGLATFLELTQVQNQTFDLQTQLTQLIYQRLNNRITLGLALGLGAPQ